MKSFLQDGINYKSTVIGEICSSQSVVGLLADSPDIDINSDQAYFITEHNIFDFDYVDKTIVRSDAFIMVDADLVAPTSGTMNAWELYVQVVCHKEFNKLDPLIFKGVKGNRCDNIVAQIDNLLNGSRIFGIGRLVLQSCRTSAVPDSFTSKLLVYRIENFRRERTSDDAN